MPDDPYSLSDLARLADVTPRTIRYYVAQGLLPSPEAAGPATRYAEGHLARLRLIRRLQRDHLPLAEIRVRLEQMADHEVQAVLDAADQPVRQPPAGTDATLAFVRDLMTRAGVAPRFYDQPADRETASGTAAAAPPGATFARVAPDEVPVREVPGLAPAELRPAPWTVPVSPVLPSSPPATPSSPAPVSPPPAPPGSPGSGSLLRRIGLPVSAKPASVDRSTWERHAISPDVEIHVRRPLDRAGNKRVERLVRIARELFEDDA
jgi:DNA-binding transcriptional MerR regulator